VRNLQDLPWFDLVRIAQLIFISVEDLHIRVASPSNSLEILLKVSPAFTVYVVGGATPQPRRRAGGLDVGDDVLLPVRNGFDRVPDLVRLRLRVNCAVKIQFSVALVSRAPAFSDLRCLNPRRVLVAQSHVSLLMSGRDASLRTACNRMPPTAVHHGSAPGKQVLRFPRLTRWW
jgi:hypothetical protein